MIEVSKNPVVIIPGVFFWDSLYDSMKNALGEYIQQKRVTIAPVSLIDWIGFPPSLERSTNRVMKIVDRTVREMVHKFPDEPVTLVAHSGGGTVAMIYLLEQPFQGDVYHPGGRVGKLITLGTPFHSREYYARIKRDFIFTHLRPEFFDRYHVVSVVSDKYYGNLQGGFVEKACFKFYEGVLDDGNVAGDGIVPAKSCFLDGAENVTISDAEHLPTPLTRWYGTKEGVEQWIQWL
jgi:pimeloyl-ACP methyl ester carboxylesterase